MNHFLTPGGAKNSWLVYLGSIVFVFIGILSIGSVARFLLLSSRVNITENTTEAELAAAFSYNEQFIINLVPFFIGFLLLIFAARIFHQRTFLSFITTRSRFDLKRFLVAFFIWGGITAILFITELFGDSAHLKWIFQPLPFLYLLGISIFLVPIQTGFEEILVRGFTLQMIGRVTKFPLTSILMSAGIFTLLHVGNPELDNMGWVVLVFYLLSGVMTALLTVLDGGVELSWGFHTANNFFSILIITSDYQAFRTDALYLDTSDPTVSWEVLVVPFVFFPLFVFALSRIYRWKSWREKLFHKLVIQNPKEEDQDDA